MSSLFFIVNSIIFFHSVPLYLVRHTLPELYEIDYGKTSKARSDAKVVCYRSMVGNMAGYNTMGAEKLLCLITGPSGSGKTCIALELQKRLLIATAMARGSRKTDTDGDIPSIPRGSPNNPDTKRPFSVVVIHQDHYFTKPFLPYKERVDDSYENGSGIDWDGLLADVQFHLKDESKNKIDHVNGDNNDDAGVKIVVVEGHLLGDAAALFRETFMVSESGGISILAVVLGGCSRETCKRRRLERRKDRSRDEQKELADYVDVFVWPSFLTYGVDAMDALRQNLVGAATTATKKKTITMCMIRNCASKVPRKQTNMLPSY